MNPQEFANKIRTKYPGAYDSLSDEDLTNKIVAKYPTYASQIKGYKAPATDNQMVSDTMPNFMAAASDTTQDIKQIGTDIKSIYNKRVGNIGEIIKSDVRGDIGSARGYFQSVGQVAGGIGDVIGAGVKGLVKGGLSQTNEERLKGAISSAATPIMQSSPVEGVINKYEEIKKTNPALAKDIDAVLGIADLASNFIGVGAGVKGATTGVKVAKTVAKTGAEAVETGIESVVKTTPKLLSYTSDVPESAFKILGERGQQVTKSIKANLKPEEILDNTRTAVRTFRKTLSDEWDSGVESIIKENTGLRYGLSDNFAKKLTTVADEFSIDLPQNIKNISALESITLLKKINELPKAMLTFSPKGALLRDVKSGLKELAVKSFGGEKGTFNNFYKNYATKKSVLDAANDIVNAYATGKPIKTATAQARLMKIFDENKSAYLDAIVDLEKVTGQDLLSDIAAGKFGKFAPTVTGLSGGFTQKALKLLVLPLTSPRIVAMIQNKLNKLPGKVKGFVDNPKAGLSIEQVKIGTKTFKEIPEATKKEMIQVIDYIRNKKDLPGAEDMLSRIAGKYNINLDLPSTKIANILEDLIENTKTSQAQVKTLNRVTGKLEGSIKK